MNVEYQITRLKSAKADFREARRELEAWLADQQRSVEAVVGPGETELRRILASLEKATCHVDDALAALRRLR